MVGGGHLHRCFEPSCVHRLNFTAIRCPFHVYGILAIYICIYNSSINVLLVSPASKVRVMSSYSCLSWLHIYGSVASRGCSADCILAILLSSHL